MDTATHRVPQQRASAYERGRAGTAAVHATRKTLQGHYAVCDGSRITTWVSGRFDETASDACPSCVAAFVPSPAAH